MIPVDIALLVGLASAMMVLGATLFRLSDDRKRATDDDVDSTYGIIQKKVLEPALLSIIESKKGRSKIKDIVRDPDVFTKLDAYKRTLFDYNESSGKRGAASAHIEHAYMASFITAGIVYLALALDALAASLALFDDLTPVAPAVGGSAAVLGAIAVGYALAKYRAEDGAFRLEMRKIRSRLS